MSSVSVSQGVPWRETGYLSAAASATRLADVPQQLDLPVSISALFSSVFYWYFSIIQ